MNKVEELAEEYDMRKTWIPVILAGLAAAVALPAATINQIDTFTTGTQGWVAPDPDNPNPPVTALGGPAGAGDAYLKLVANGGIYAPELAGSRLVALNETQWTGDFIGAGINAISMDVMNAGPADVFLRLLFESFTQPGPPTALALSQNAVFVPAGTGWTHIVLPIDPASLTAPIGTVQAALSNTSVMRIFSNPNPTFGGPGNGPPMINVVFGVDNITAEQVPEPSTMLLMGAGIAVVALLRRR